MRYVLCRHCRFRTPAGYVLCKHCGHPLPGNAQPPAPLILEAPGARRLLAQGTTRLGRMTDNEVVLADALASRHHAVIRRDRTGRYLVEDLQSANGTFLNGVRVSAPAGVHAEDVLRIGQTILRLHLASEPLRLDGQPALLRPEPTLVNPAPGPPEQTTGFRHGPDVTMFEILVPGARLGATFRPWARAGWALKRQYDARGQEYYILKSLDRSVYLRLSERDVFFWKLMDGAHSLRDLLVAYLQEYQALGADRLFDLLDELTAKGFLQNAAPPQPPRPHGIVGRATAAMRAVLGALRLKEVSVQGADDLITRIYQRVAWRLYSTLGQAALAAVAIAGVAAFVYLSLRGGQSLFEIGGSVAWGLVALGVAGAGSIFLHEMGHALTTKSYNRQVRRVGLWFFYGMPFFLVDTSDIWMEPKEPRIQVSLGGPYASLLVGSVASLAILAYPSPLVAALLFKLAALAYLTVLLSLNPLYEGDGYFVLMDWLETPLLRRRSVEFVRRRLWRKLWVRDAFTRDEKLFAVFGVLAGLWSVVFVGIALLYWRDRLAGTLRGELVGGTGYITVALLGLVLLWIAARSRRERARRRGEHHVAGSGSAGARTRAY